RFEISGLSAQSNAELLLKQAKRFNVKNLGIADVSKYGFIKDRLPKGVKIYTGKAGISELAGSRSNDLVLVAISGSASIRPTYAAVASGRTVALASKEALVSAGYAITSLAKKTGAMLLPVDSEHSAVFQCLQGHDISYVDKLCITASGGPLFNMPKQRFDTVTSKDVLRHPKWKMGKKITVDSATLMNKGLEVIEAKWLFGIEVDHIDVIIHPEAIVHSMVKFIDGSVLAQLGITDMRLPIQYALNYPNRFRNSLRQLDLTDVEKLTFYKPDMKKFPSLKVAYEAARQGGSAPCVLSVANEEAVKAFLMGKLPFTEIIEVIERALSRHRVIERPSIEQIEALEEFTKEEVKKWV
ncbi:MAG: 1-deoxy-D-xylulose-5-phosphate reductoisomerase, partial [Candidatus Omnitrophica bacterium]|nr:1-deoxy-D-xylulose-5-phosphate reductoisomerase [Candidatus Omnitrophota bacterium]